MLAPSCPGSPFKLENANAKFLACEVPPIVTVTEGVPTLLSTVAVAPVISALVPFVPFIPSAPLGIVKLKTAALEVPLLVTLAFVPGFPVDVVPTVTVAA